MAEKRSYPMLPVSHWWGLRKRFKQSIPGTVTASYLAAALDMKERSARGNILPYLQQLGIIDDEGKTLERARQWRDDAQYASVCKQMREDVYPDDLLDAVPDPDADRDAAGRWFANNTGAGVVAVRRMTSLYTVLVKGDPENGETSTTSSSSSTKKTTTRKAAIKSRKAKPPTENARFRNPESPGVHINVQVHVSSDATSDQIDQIFASMAKHIYRRE